MNTADLPVYLQHFTDRFASTAVLLLAMCLVCAGCGDDSQRDFEAFASSSLPDARTDLRSLPERDAGIDGDEFADTGVPLEDTGTDTSAQDQGSPDTSNPDTGNPDTDSPDDVEELYGFIGSPCNDDSDCPYDDGYCIVDDDGFTNGMCSSSCDLYCPDDDGYPTTFCIETEVGGECHSRCDFGSYPSGGCRLGYQCQLESRNTEPSTEQYSCVPSDGADVPLSTCMQFLVDHGVPFELTTYATRSPEGLPNIICAVEEPIRLHSPVNNIDFRYYYHDAGDFRPMTMSCNLARALYEMTEVLHEDNIVEVVHVGTTVCKGTSERVSQHGLGLAIDISGFIDDDDVWYGVYDHWEHDADDPEDFKAQMLYDFAHRLFDDWIFNVILTPEYNDAHDNHFHIDLTAGSHFLRATEAGGFPYLGPNTTGD